MIAVKGRLWLVVLLAFLAMCVQDIFGTIMVVFEAKLNAPVAGAFDVLGWIAGLICSALALEEIIKNGWRTRKSLAIIGAVSVANFVGTYAGVYMSIALTRGHG
jgi:hypothetical protein